LAANKDAAQARKIQEDATHANANPQKRFWWWRRSQTGPQPPQAQSMKPNEKIDEKGIIFRYDLHMSKFYSISSKLHRWP